MDNKKRADIQIGAEVDIVLKKDQPTGKLTRGHVKRILTNKSYHPRGIKVMLKEGDQVGRVQKIISNPELINNEVFNTGSLDDIINSLK